MASDKRFHRLFPDDVSTATSYYDKISVNLGNRFRDRVRDKLRSVSERPQSYAYIRRPLRGAMVEGFPYLLIFQLIDSEVYFAGLYHASSNPDRWLDRVDKN